MATKRSSVSVNKMARECIAVRLRLINRAVTNIYDDALRPHGLRISQMNLLMVISRLGPAKPSEIAPLLQMDASTLSRNIDRMRRQGWITTIDDEHDARVQRLKISPKGKQILDKAGPAWRSAQKEAVSVLGNDGVSAIGDMAEKFWSGA